MALVGLGDDQPLVRDLVLAGFVRVGVLAFGEVRLGALLFFFLALVRLGVPLALGLVRVGVPFFLALVRLGVPLALGLVRVGVPFFLALVRLGGAFVSVGSGSAWRLGALPEGAFDAERRGAGGRWDALAGFA